MKDIKDELQNIILGDEQIGSGSQLKETQSFLRSYAEASSVDASFSASDGRKFV